MASWSDLLDEFQQNVQSDPNWLSTKLIEHLGAISRYRDDTSVMFYASAFLQKGFGDVSITREDINGFMNALYEAPTGNGLTLMVPRCLVWVS